uniref:Uncharacterized protein n=1 Tax=Candidatus Kentrum sp. DK TaxID=2126562 RepID=A0A450SER9_9GAMM|nr:MAG: hypothetical protein BECKDK2373B_GA0170837_103226 [Candidatus Kentron sp. DK]
MSEEPREIKETHLPMEYEQTVQTLRNWDTLFFNAFSSILIAGGIGGIVAIGKAGEFKYVIELMAFAITALYIVVVFYYLYNILIASRKFAVLSRIEKELGLVGVYSSHTTRIRSILVKLLLPLFSVLYICAIYTLLMLPK